MKPLYYFLSTIIGKMTYSNVLIIHPETKADSPAHSTGTEPTLTQVIEQVTLLSRCKRTGLNIKTVLLITKETIPMQT